MRKNRSSGPIALSLVLGGLFAAIRLCPALHQSQVAAAVAPALGTSTGPVNMLLGNPSAATADRHNSDNFLMEKTYYSMSYNNSAGEPNWVSWRVAAGDLGDAPRKRVFDPDTTLPATFYRVLTKDYTSSGFDRGHMCPHSDRSATEEMSYSTFVMSNIIPQAPNVNQKAWADFEDYGRELVRKDHVRLYIIAGPAGTGGTGTSGLEQNIAKGKIRVPAECWKIMVVVPEAGGDNDLAKIKADTRVICVVVPNENTVGHDWEQYRRSVAEVEKKTGLQFFDRLPATVAAALNEKTDSQKITQAAPTRRGR